MAKVIASLLQFALVILALFAAPAQAQFFSDKGSETNNRIVPFNSDIQTRNKVLVYTNKSQSLDDFFFVARSFKIRFFGLYGESDDFVMMDHYMAQAVQTDREGSPTLSIFPPFAKPYSGASTSKAGRIDLHDIPIPPSIGPILGVMIDTAGPRDWAIDKIVVDGRTFAFGPHQGALGFRRFASHFLFGQAAGTYPQTSSPFKTAYRGLISKAVRGQDVTVQTSMWNQANSAAVQLPANYDASEPYLEPTKPDHQKSVTVRLAFDRLRYVSTNQIGPVLEVKLISTDGRESAVLRTDSPLIFDEKYVTFTGLSGDFKVQAVDLTLVEPATKGACLDKTLFCQPVNDGMRADIVEIGVLTEEALTPELVFQGKANLSLGQQEATRVFRNLYADGLSLDDFQSVDGQATLAKRTPNQTFSVLATTPAEAAVLAKVRANHRIDDVKLDIWFLNTADFDVNVSTILRDIDEGLPRYGLNAEEQKIWRSVLKARLLHALTNRKNALKLFLRLEANIEASFKVFTTELFVMDQFFGLEAGQRVKNAPPPAPKAKDETLDFLGTAFEIASTLSEKAGPEGEIASKVFSVLGQLTGALDTLLSGGSEEVPDGFESQTNIDDSGNQNKLSIMSANERLAILKRNQQTLETLKKLRALAMRDFAVLQNLAEAQVNYVSYVAPLGSDNDVGAEMRSTFAQGFNEASQLAIREYLVRKYLPVRGMIFGKPIKAMPSAKLARMFPGGQDWPGMRTIARDEACPRGCDGVFAFSVNILPKVHDKLFTSRRSFERQHVAWQLGFGGRGDEGVALASEQIVKGQAISGPWDYVMSVLEPNQVFDLVALQPDPIILAPQRNYEYIDVLYFSDPRDIALTEPFGTYAITKSAGLIDKIIPSWPPGSIEGITVRNIGSARLFAVDQLCEGANVTKDVRKCKVEIPGIRDLLRPGKGPIVNHKYMTYSYTEKGVTDSVVIPDAIVMLRGK